tara:strand:+ start:25108 stop:26841 length:1734 start_codon:yes stop_codon:yes gene_type:complete
LEIKKLTSYDSSEEKFKGYVLGTEQDSAKPLEFSVFVAPGQYLQLDDVVHVATSLPNGGTPIDIYGVVDEVIAKHEGVQLTSDVALVNEGILPANSVVSAHVSVTRVEPEIYIPPTPGDIVNIATVDKTNGNKNHREIALFFDNMQKKIPLGYSRDEEVIYGNLDFLTGISGAHVNISGISGVATKTSYATYLLYALFSGKLLEHNSKSYIFNVKDESLLWLDRRNLKMDSDIKNKYAILGITAPGAFAQVDFFSPVRKKGDISSSAAKTTTAFHWSVKEFCDERYLRFLFSEADTDQTQIHLLIDSVSNHLASAVRKGGASVSINGKNIKTFDALVQEIGSELDDDSSNWKGRGSAAASQGTINAFMRRLNSIKEDVYFIRDPDDTTTQSGISASKQVNVINLHGLRDRAQRFVVGVLLDKLIKDREKGADRSPFFLVVDELNKYAPREGTSPIKEILIDIAERGRSLGIILIGAQQTASEVEPRVVGNAAFRIVGRLDGAEVERNEYRFLRNSSLKQRATQLKPGSMLIQQPEVPVPLLVQFPMPSWATRQEEAGEAGDADKDAQKTQEKLDKIL